MRTRSVLLLGLLAGLLPTAASAAGKCDTDGLHGAAVLAAREALRERCDCEEAAGHASYVACARNVIRDLADTGSLPRMCRARMMQYAVRSTCGEKQLAVCCESNDAFHVFPAIRRKGECRIRRGGTCVSRFPHLAEACTNAGTICRASHCGDGITDRRNGEGCEPPGVGLCDPWCQVIVCGNGVLDPGEQCEPPRTPTCDFTCRSRNCGDGVVEPNVEECEPPNTQTCDAECYVRHDCGNGVVDAGYGEQCEPPGTATCDAQCRFVHTCGNGVIEPGEECDGQPACNGNCALTRSLCCQLGDMCFNGAATDGFSEYQFAKGCSYILAGRTAHGVCQGTEPCPPPAPASLGCLVGSCGDEPIDPLPLCCQHPDGTCTGSVATTAGSVGGCSTFPPPDQGDVDRLMLGTCGGDGRCVPLGSGGTP